MATLTGIPPVLCLSDKNDGPTSTKSLIIFDSQQPSSKQMTWLSSVRSCQNDGTPPPCLRD